VYVTDEVAETKTKRKEVEERLEEAAEDRHPRTAVDHQVPLEEQMPARSRQRERGHVTSLPA
jgi:hypothetical protein